MKTAIDRFELGREKEVNIKEYDGYNRSNRFVCPECGEYVFPRAGKRTCFSHFKKTDVDCNKRVDGQVSCTFYERVGLPIYLKNEKTHFSLNIGFYALGSSLLKLSQSENLIVFIDSANSYTRLKQEFLVDFTFFEDQITLKPLSFIPYSGCNYKITLSKSHLANRIYERWSDYADGFTSYGALFTFSESVGKKIRRNDTISTDTEYYVMLSSGRLLPKSGITSIICGNLNINGRKYEVLKIIIQPKDKADFQYLENFFWDSFRLKLLYSKPEIIPLWPPSVQSNDINMLLPTNPKNNTVFCKVTSDNDNPVVYRYFGNTYTETKVSKLSNGNIFVNLPISESLQPFTVDRKYLANAIMLSCKKPVPKLENIGLLIDGLPIATDFHNQKSYCIDKYKTIKITSNSRISLISIEKRKDMNREFITDAVEKTIGITENIAEIWVYSEIVKRVLTRLYKQSAGEISADIAFSDEKMLEKIKPLLQEQLILIPRKYSSLLYKLKSKPLIYTALKPAIAVGKIQPTILKLLEIGGFFNEH